MSSQDPTVLPVLRRALSQVRQRESLRQGIESISGELHVAPLLERTVHFACQLLQADRGSIALVDQEKNLVRIVAADNMPAGEIGAEYAPGVGLAGQVLLHRQLIALHPAAGVGLLLHRELQGEAALGVPIFWENEIIGVLCTSAAPPRQFDAQDAEIAQVFARHTAIAIQNARLYEHSQRNLSELRFLYEISERMTTAMDVDQVIAAYLDEVAARGKYTCSIVLYQFNQTGQRTGVVIRGRWSAEHGREQVVERHDYTRDALDPALDAGATITMRNVETDPRASLQLRELQKSDGRPALALIPLMARGQRIGLVALSYGTVHDWSDADLWLYKVTAAQLATVIDSRRQRLALYERGQQLAILEERQRLARDLHDSVTQMIFSTTLIAQSLTSAWRRDPAEGERRVERLLELSQTALAEMRALLAELRPSTSEPEPVPGTPDLHGILRLARAGLPAALDEHVKEYASDDLVMVLDTTGYIRRASPEIERAIFRIAQEALNNIVKHAQARHVNITLTSSAKETCLMVHDDGLGFELERLGSNQKRGMGLQTMPERARALGGQVSIRTAPGEGTIIQVSIPQ